MKCPNCGSESLEYDEYWMGEGEDSTLVRYYDCLVCKHRINNYDDEFKHPEDS